MSNEIDLTAYGTREHETSQDPPRRSRDTMASIHPSRESVFLLDTDNASRNPTPDHSPSSPYRDPAVNRPVSGVSSPVVSAAHWTCTSSPGASTVRMGVRNSPVLSNATTIRDARSPTEPTIRVTTSYMPNGDGPIIDAPPASDWALKLLQEQVDMLQESFESRNKEVEVLRQDLKEARGKVEKLEKQCQDVVFSTELASFRKDIESVKNKKNPQDIDTSFLTSTPLREEIADLKAQIQIQKSRLISETTQRMSVTNRLIADKDKLFETTDRVSNESDNFAGDIGTLFQESSQRKKRVESLESDVNHIKADAKKHNDRMITLSQEVVLERQRRVEAVEPDIKQLQNDIREVELQLKSISAKEDNDVKYSSLSTDVANLRTRTKNIEIEVGRNHSAYERGKGDMDELKSRVTTMEESIAGVKALANSLQGFILPQAATFATEVKKILESQTQNDAAYPAGIHTMVVTEVKEALHNAAAYTSPIRAEVQKEIQTALGLLETAMLSQVQKQVKKLEDQRQGKNPLVLELQKSLADLSKQVSDLLDAMDGPTRDSKDPYCIVAIMSRQNAWMEANGPELQQLQKAIEALKAHVEENKRQIAEIMKAEQHAREVEVTARTSTNSSSAASSKSTEATVQKLKEKVRTLIKTSSGTASDISEIKGQQETMTKIQDGLRMDLDSEISQHTAFVKTTEERFKGLDEGSQAIQQKHSLLSRTLDRLIQSPDVRFEGLRYERKSADQAAPQPSTVPLSIAKLNEMVVEHEATIKNLHEAQAQAKAQQAPLIDSDSLLAVKEKLSSLEQGQTQLNLRLGQKNTPQTLSVHSMAISSLEKRFNNLMTNELAQAMIDQLRQSQNLFDPANFRLGLEQIRNAVLNQQGRLTVAEQSISNHNKLAEDMKERLFTVEASYHNQHAAAAPTASSNTSQLVETNEMLTANSVGGNIEDRITALDINISMLLRQLKLPSLAPSSSDEPAVEPSPPLKEQLELDLKTIQENLTFLREKCQALEKKLLRREREVEELRINNLKNNIQSTAPTMSTGAKTGLGEIALAVSDDETSDDEPIVLLKGRRTVTRREGSND
jgi:DNA repair exonuclease SbcCD ATPase subunit